VREVDQLQDPVDEGVPERDDTVDRAARQAVERDVDELRRALEEVDDEPEPDERHQAEADAVDELRVAEHPQHTRDRVTHRLARL
jgi:hypothetical protein